MCRCLLADALVRVEDSGLDPVLHVHDEIVCLVPGAYGAEASGYLHEIMMTLPGWAKGFPVGAAGFHGRRYRK
jgi:DNA polymerase